MCYLIKEINNIIQDKHNQNLRYGRILQLAQQNRNKYLKDNYARKVDCLLPLLSLSSSNNSPDKYISSNAIKAFKKVFPECFFFFFNNELKMIHPNILSAILLTLIKLSEIFHFKINCIAFHTFYPKFFPEYTFNVYETGEGIGLDINHIKLSKFFSLSQLNRSLVEDKTGLGDNINEYLIHEVAHILVLDNLRRNKAFDKNFLFFSKPTLSVPGSEYSKVNFNEYIAEAFLFVILRGDIDSIWYRDIIEKYIDISLVNLKEIRTKINPYIFHSVIK